MTSFPSEKYSDLVSKVGRQTYSNPNECLECIGLVDKMFADALEEDFSCSPMPLTSKIRLRDLARLCAPILDYDIEETYRWLPQRIKAGRTDYIAPVYSLRIHTSAAEIVRQEEALYATALGSFSNPMLKSGVTPHYILTELIDRYSQEMGIDDPQEIARIVNRLLWRFFTDEVEPDAHESDTPACQSEPEAIGGNFTNFADVMRAARSARRIVATRFRENYSGRKRILSSVAEWISPGPVGISVVAESIPDPIMDDVERCVKITYPKMLYTIVFPTKQLETNLKKFVSIFRSDGGKALVRTSLTSVRDGLKAILSLPPQDISLSLRKVIEDNFNVTLIEVDSEGHRYATPEYFEVSRSNVSKVVTTRPAVIGPDGKIIAKGIYVVPMN